MKNLGADVKPVALKDIYSAVERLVPPSCATPATCMRLPTKAG